MYDAAQETAGQSRQFYIDVNGEHLWVSTQGVGESFPLLLIMGFGGHLGLWRPLRKALGAYETIAFDLPGMGKSAPPHRLMRACASANLIVKLLDKLGYGQVDVLGVSMGGGLAQQLTHQAPERVRRLVLCATAAGIGGTIPGRPRSLLSLVTPHRDGGIGAIEKLPPATFGGLSSRKPEALRETLALLSGGAPSLRGSLSQLYAVSGWTSVPWLRTIKQPTLVMSGDDDRIVPLINGRILRRLIPNSRLHIVRGGGHLFVGDQPEETAAVIRSFLA